MAKQFESGVSRRFINRIMSLMIRWDIAPAGYRLLTVPGRKSGKQYTLPVTLIEDTEDRWLVSPYGLVSWVHNARAAGEVTVARGKTSEVLGIDEVGPEIAAPVLRTYIENIAIVRPYFDCQPDSPLDDFVAEAERHPVFRLVQK